MLVEQVIEIDASGASGGVELWPHNLEPETQGVEYPEKVTEVSARSAALELADPPTRDTGAIGEQLLSEAGGETR